MHLKKLFALLLVFVSTLGYAQNDPVKDPYAFIPGVYYTQGFEGTSFPPAKWSITSVLGTETWNRTTSSHNGKYGLYIKADTKAGEDWVKLPKYIPVSGDSLVLYIKPYYENSSNDFLDLMYSTSGTSYSVLKSLGELIDYSSTKWTRIAVSIPLYSNGIYLAIRHTTPAGGGCGVYVDDISVGQPNLKTAGSAWFSEVPLPAARSAHGSAFSTDLIAPDNGSLYVISGTAGKTPLSDPAQTSSFKYDIYSKEWIEFATDNPGKFISAGEMKGTLYVPSGLDQNGSFFNYGRTYDILSGTWSNTAKELTDPINDYAMGVYQDTVRNKTYVYTFGGKTSILRTNIACQMYDVAAGQWTTMDVSGITTKNRYGARGGIIGNKIILVGGVVDGKVTDEVIIGTISYNSSSGKPSIINWSNPAHYPGGKVTGINAGAWDGKDKKYVIFTGGDSTTNGAGVLKSTWVYDGVESKWIEGPDRKTPLTYASVSPIVRNDSVFFAATGGLTSAGSLTNNEWLYVCNDVPNAPHGIDVSTVSIDMPSAAPFAPLTPTATVINRLADAQDAFVTMEITPGTYKKSQWANKLAFGQPTQVSFGIWDPVPGTYTVKVYTYVSGDEDKRNDTLTSTITISATDVAPLKIESESLILVNKELSPKAQFTNYGGTTESFNVTMKITPGFYSVTKSIDNLTPAETSELTFDKFVPSASGVYTIKVFTSLAKDGNKLNDTLTSTFNVSTGDVAPVELTVPATSMATKEIAPKAKFVNNADLEQTFNVTMKITPGGYEVVKTIENLAPKASIELDFNKWFPSPEGVYTVKVFTSNADDENKANDTLKACVTVTPLILEKDIAATSLNLPARIFKDVEITPTVDFTNYGSEGFMYINVTMKISPGNYVSKQTISVLNPNKQATVKFDKWTPLAAVKYSIVTYCSLSGDENKSNDSIKAEINVYAPESDNDIAPSKINIAASALINKKLTPKAEFINRGRLEQSFDVTMKITPGDYTSVKTVSSLGAIDTTLVDFDDWTPTAVGSYEVKIYSSLATDELKDNDTLMASVIVISPDDLVDIAASKIKIASPILVNEEVMPKAEFSNKGGKAQTFDVTMKITPGDYVSVKTISSLGAKSSASAEFEKWIPAASGTYNVIIYSSIESDIDKSNDTLMASITVSNPEVVNVSASKINVPASILVNKETTVKADFVNKGSKAQTFDITMKITPGNYSNVKTVESLAVQDTIAVEFDKWTPAASGLHKVIVYSSLEDDSDKLDDTLTVDVNVDQYDTETYALDLKRLMEPNEKTLPQAEFVNNGTQPQTFTAIMKIVPGDYRSEKTVTNLGASDTLAVEFEEWTPAEAGSYTVKVYGIFANDNNNANDTLYAKVNVLESRNDGDWFSEEPAPVTRMTNTAVYYSKKAEVKGEDDKRYIFVINYDPDTELAKASSKYYSSVYDINAGKWNDAASLPGYLDEFKAVYSNGKIYVPGGLSLPEGAADPKGSDKLFIYDTETDKWSLGASLPQAAASYAIGLYRDSLIYVIGGYDKQESESMLVNKAQIYNIKENVWHVTEEYKGLQAVINGGIVKNKIVVTGGVDSKFEQLYDKVIVGEIDTLNPYKITWMEKSSYPAGVVYGLISAPYETKEGNFIAFTGGSLDEVNAFNYSPYTLTYDPEKNTWTKLPDLQVPSYLGAGLTAVRNDSVYFVAVSGYNKGNTKGLNQWLYLGEAVEDTIGSIDVDGELQNPASYELSQNYPNPFNPSTVIKYSIAKAGLVELAVYNMLGQEVKVLVKEYKNAGTYETVFEAAGLNLSSGMYIYRLRTNDFVQSKKLMLIK